MGKFLKNKKLFVLIAAVFIGVINGIVFKVFEFIVQEGSEYIWNDLFRSDENRWVVVPLAVVLGVLFSFVLRTLKESRWVKPQIDLLADDESTEKVTLRSMCRILLSGIASLLAGASLGPEAPLTENSKALGQWIGQRAKLGSASTVLMLSSVGALMVAFFGTPLLILLPILVLYQKTKKLPVGALIAFVLAGLSAYGTLLFVDKEEPGFAQINAHLQVHASDYLAAVVVGLLVALGAFALKWLLLYFATMTKRLDLGLPWYLSAALFGLVIGVLYLLGGETVQFSGSTGSATLYTDRALYGTWAFLGFALIKLLVTAWSKAAGYRGGLVFPSLYMGIALGLMIGSLVTALDGPGAIVGSVGGIFTAVIGSPVVGLLLLIALFPVNLLGLAVVATIAAFVGSTLTKRYLPVE